MPAAAGISQDFMVDVSSIGNTYYIYTLLYKIIVALSHKKRTFDLHNERSVQIPYAHFN